MVRVCVDVKIEPVKVACVVECVFIIKSVSLEISGDNARVLEKISSRNLEQRKAKRDGWSCAKSLLLQQISNEY